MLILCTNRVQVYGKSKALALSVVRAHTLSRSLYQSLARTRASTNTCVSPGAHTHTYYTHTNTRTHTRTHAHTRARARTHTHTNPLSLGWLPRSATHTRKITWLEVPKTLNPKPPPDPKPHTLHPEPSDPRPCTLNPTQTLNPKPQTLNPKP